MKFSFRSSLWPRFLFAVIGLAALCYLLLFIESYDNQQANEEATAPFISESCVPPSEHLILWDRFGTKSKYVTNTSINVLVTFAHAGQSKTLTNKLRSCLSSMFATRKELSIMMRLYILTDAPSLPTAQRVLRNLTSNQASIEVCIYDLEKLVQPLRETVSIFQSHFSAKPGAYYSDSLFFLSVSIHQVLPLRKILSVDVDTLFAEDIFDLWKFFDSFSSTAFIGLGHEQQPVYNHLLREYHNLHPKTTFGEPLDNNGNPGFNSGVLLLDLEKMRNSEVYNNYLNASALGHLTTKYSFKGHLGDQDFYTVLSFEHPELFYVLPCTWNRQLCKYWRDYYPAKVFEQFNKCKGSVKLYHGNCNTPLPLMKLQTIQ